MKYLITSLFVLSSLIIFSQKNGNDTTEKTTKKCESHVITIDAKNGILSNNPKSLKYGESVAFKFININPLVLKTVIATKSFNFETDVPMVLQDLIAAPDTKATGNNKNQTVSHAIEAYYPDGKESNEFNKYKIQFINYYDSIVRTINTLSSLTKIESYIKGQLKDYILDSAIVKQNLREYLNSIVFNYNVNFNTNYNVQSIRNVASTGVVTFNSYYTKLNFAYDTLGLTLSDDTLKLTGKLTADDKKTTLEILNAKVAVKRKKYFEEQFAYANKQYKLFLVDSVRSNLSKAINSGLDLYNTILSSDFSLSEGPFPIDNESEEFTPTLKNSKGETIKDFKSIKIKGYGKLKVDFSAGYLASFIGDEHYTSYNDTAGKIKGFSLDAKEMLTNSVGGLFHAYWQSKCNLNFGFSAGFSVPIEGKFNLYTGLSAYMLEKNRLVITAGCSFNQVKRLNTAQLESKGNEHYEILKGNSVTEASYSKVFRPAFFIGLTYNLFSIKK